MGSVSNFGAQFASYVGDRFARQRTQREATRFERSVKAGRTYYSVEECEQSWGNEPRVLTCQFEKTRGDGLKCGHMSPALVWLNYGPIYDTDPGKHLRRVFENDDPSEQVLKQALADLGRHVA